MNLFKKILSGNQATKQPAPTGPAYSPRMEEVLEELPELNKGMSLDVVTKDGKLLVTGRISAVTAAGLTLERMPGWLAFDTVNIGETVNLRGFTKQMLAFNLSGTVRESSRIIFRVQNLRVEHVINQRLTFRLPINGPAYLFRQDDGLPGQRSVPWWTSAQAAPAWNRSMSTRRTRCSICASSWRTTPP